MKKQIFALVAALTLVIALFVGCGATGTETGSTPSGGDGVNTPQLVVAMNPFLLYDDATTVISYNDLRAAMAADSENSTLSSFGQTAWRWCSPESETSWTQRATYDWGKWTSGTGAQTKGVFAYTFNQAGDLSLGLYNKQNAKLAGYGTDVAADTGLLVSVTGTQEEALTYVVEKDGVLTIPTGTFTAVNTVNGVKTGFLAEDGTSRSASVRIMVNNVQVWSGTLMNSTAAEDSVAVTQLSYPQLSDLHVKAGNLVCFSFKLDAQANAADDVTAPTVNEKDNWAVTKKSKLVKVEHADEGGGYTDIVQEDGSIALITDYAFNFTLVREQKYSAMIAEMADTLMTNTKAEIPVSKLNHKEVPYEIIIGEYAARPGSLSLTKEVKTARSDNAGDYRIKLDGTKLYIVAANDDALQSAVDYFVKTFGQDDKGKIPADYDYWYRPKHETVLLAGQNIANYVIRTERNPSVLLQKAAEDLKQYVLDICGYIMEIRPMNDAGNDHVANEIRIGPMNGSVKVERAYDTFFTAATEKTVGRLNIQTDGYTGEPGAYAAKFSGKNLIVSGGSAYAVSAAMTEVLAKLKADKALPANYSVSGNYSSRYDYAGGTGYETMDYGLTDGFGLAYADEFSYTGTEDEIVKAFKSRWTVDSDTSNATREGEKQFRPGIYGENWWITRDNAQNGYLVEITKRVEGGYDAGRMNSINKWGFRYGLWETRLVMGCRNGACSSVWSVSAAPVSVPGVSNELDIYENYGRELLVPFSHAYKDGQRYYSFKNQTVGWEAPREGEHFYNTFHHVSMDWTHDYVKFYLDGKCISVLTLTDAEYRFYRVGTTIRLANGVGTLLEGGKGYTGLTPDLTRGDETYDPEDWMDDVSKFFEVQLVDYTRIYQTSNEGKSSVQQNQLTFVRSFDK